MPASTLRHFIALVLVSASTTSLQAFQYGLEPAEGFLPGPAPGQPAGAPAKFAADPIADSPRFQIVPGIGVDGSHGLRMETKVAKNFESLLVPLAPTDYGESSGPATKLFRIGVSILRENPTLARLDPDLTFEWGSAGDYRLVKLRAGSGGELIVYEHNRTMPHVIPDVFGPKFRRIEAVVNVPARTWRLFIDGEPQLAGRDLLFGSPGRPPEDLKVGFSAMVLGPNYVFDNFTCAPEPGPAPIAAAEPARPDDAIKLPPGSLPPLNINPKFWQPSEHDRRAFMGGIETNWYIAFRSAYPNLPKFKKADGSETLRIGEEMFDPSRPLARPQRPRLFFGELPVVPGKTPFEVLRDRATDPAFADVVAQIRRQARSGLDTPFPPAIPDKDGTTYQSRPFSEDPLRGQTEYLYWLALGYIIESDPAQRALLQARLRDWISIHLDWGPSAENLPLGQSTAALATMYDWFYGDFLAADPVFRKRLKEGIVQRVRFRNDWANRRVGARNPIPPPHFNHAWFNVAGPATAGLALWGEHDADLPASEIQSWLVEGLNSFSMQQGIMPADGGTFEGWSYEDYGHRPVFDFVTNAEMILGLGGQLIDSDANRNRASRIFFLTPTLTHEQMRFGDGFAMGGRGGSPYHYLAKRYRDGRAQRLADLQIAGDPNFWPLIPAAPSTGNDFWPIHWRSIFWKDPTVPATPLAELPLSTTGEDYGLVAARSSWAADGTASAMSFRCGPSIGSTALRVWNNYNFYNNHAYPAVGHVTFFDGPLEILPTTEWLGVKWSGYFNGAVFEPRDGQKAVNDSATTNTLIGQVNERVTSVPPEHGLPYSDEFRVPRILKVENLPNLQTWLLEYGGIYELDESRNTDKRRTTFPVYHRRIVYLPERNVVVVADRIRTFYPRRPVFLVPTRAITPELKTTSPGHGVFDFTQANNHSDRFGRQKPEAYDGRIVFFSSTPGTATVLETPVATPRDNYRRTLAYTPNEDVTLANFGFAVGRKSNLEGLRFEITDSELVISGLATGDARFPLTDEPPNSP